MDFYKYLEIGPFEGLSGYFDFPKRLLSYIYGMLYVFLDSCYLSFKHIIEQQKNAMDQPWSKLVY